MYTVVHDDLLFWVDTGFNNYSSLKDSPKNDRYTKYAAKSNWGKCFNILSSCCVDDADITVIGS